MSNVHRSKSRAGLQHGKVFLLFSIVLSFLLFGVLSRNSTAFAQPSNEQWQVFIDPSFGFQIEYPAEWHASLVADNVNKAYSYDEHVALRSFGFFGPNSQMFFVDVWANPNRLSLDEWLLQHPFYLDTDPQLTFTTHAVKISDVTGVQVVGVPINEELNIPWHIRTQFIYNDLVFNIEYDALSPDLDIYQTALDSFSFVEQTRSQYQKPDITDTLPPVEYGAPLAATSGAATCCNVTDTEYNPFPCNTSGEDECTTPPCGNCTWWVRYARTGNNEANLYRCTGNGSTWVGCADQYYPHLLSDIPEADAVVVWLNINHVTFIESMNGTSAYRVSQMGWTQTCPERYYDQTHDASLYTYIRHPDHLDTKIKNGSFEEGIEPWAFTNEDNVCNQGIGDQNVFDQENKHFLMTNRNFDANCFSLYQDVGGDFSVGETYNFGIWVRASNENAPREGRIGLWALGGEQESSQATPFTTTGSEWSCFETSLTIANEGHTQLKPEVYLDSTVVVDGVEVPDDSDYYFDNAILQKDGVACTTFLDVPSDNSFYEYIEKWNERGVTDGCHSQDYDGLRWFCPETELERGPAMIFLGRGIAGVTNPTSIFFMKSNLSDELSDSELPITQEIRDEFLRNNVVISENATVSKENDYWVVSGLVTNKNDAEVQRTFWVREEGAYLHVYLREAYSDIEQDIDNPSEKPTAEDFTLYFTARGVVSGYSTGEFKLNEKVTRGAWAKMIVNSLDNKGISCSREAPYDEAAFLDAFSDVSGSAFYQEIWCLWQIVGEEQIPDIEKEGEFVTIGYSDETFRPNQVITREQASKWSTIGMFLVDEKDETLEDDTFELWLGIAQAQANLIQPIVSLTNSSPLSASSTIENESLFITPDGDEEWVKVNVGTTETIQFTTLENGLNADIRLELYDPTKTTVLAAHQELARNGGTVLEWTPPQTGIYWLRATNTRPYALEGTDYILYGHVKQQQADLVIDHIELKNYDTGVLYDPGDTIPPNTTVDMVVFIKNIGKVDVTDSVWLEYFDNGNYLDDDSETSYLFAGGRNIESELERFVISGNGQHTLKVCLDTTSVIIESNESNNCDTFLVNVGYPSEPPATPSNFYISYTSKNSITLAWNDVSYEDEYWIYKWQNNTDTLITITNINATSYSDTNLNCGQTFYYRIRSRNEYGWSNPTGYLQGTTLPCSNKPDLIVSSITITRLTNSIDYDYEITNIGDVAVDLWDEEVTIQSFVSADQIYDGVYGDVAAGGFRLSGILTPGASKSGSFSAGFYVSPASYPYLLMMVDSLEKVDESIETNNIKVAWLLGDSPDNDDFNLAKNISTQDYTITMSTVGATWAADDPFVSECGLNQGTATVWYKYTPTADSAISLDTKTSDYDTFIAVWTGTRTNLNYVTCNDDIDRANGIYQAQVAFQVQAGVTYYIEIGEFAGYYGTSATSSTEK